MLNVAETLAPNEVRLIVYAAIIPYFFPTWLEYGEKTNYFM
jgi:hypothetical protein